MKRLLRPRVQLRCQHQGLMHVCASTQVEIPRLATRCKNGMHTQSVTVTPKHKKKNFGWENTVVDLWRGTPPTTSLSVSPRSPPPFVNQCDMSPKPRRHQHRHRTGSATHLRTQTQSTYHSPCLLALEVAALLRHRHSKTTTSRHRRPCLPSRF